MVCEIWIQAGKAVCCDERLSEAQTAVARGNLGMSKNLKPFRFQLANQMVEHQPVVERAAAQADPIERRFLSKQARKPHESLDQSIVKSPTDCFRAHFPAEIFDDGAEQCRGLDLPVPVLAANGEGIASRSRVDDRPDISSSIAACAS